MKFYLLANFPSHVFLENLELYSFPPIFLNCSVMLCWAIRLSEIEEAWVMSFLSGYLEKLCGKCS